MASSLLSKINNAIVKFEQSFALAFGFHKGGPPPFAFCVTNSVISEPKSYKPFSLKDIIGDGILWAVPKHRRSIEKRLKRKYGHPDYHMKLLLPKTNIRICNTCGDHHEIGVLCPTCYRKVMDETHEMQTAIQNELGLKPVENEIVVLYDNEKNVLEGTYEGQQIVEMKKPRPSWFSKNLLQQTTQQPATTKDVKPTGLS